MANGIWAEGLVVDDLDLGDGPFAFRIIQGFGEQWETRGEDVPIPGVDGQSEFPRELHRLLIVAKGFVMGDGDTETEQRSDFATNLQTLRAKMNPKLASYTLEHVDEGGTSWFIEARPLPNGIDWGEDGIPSRRDAALQWVAIGADWTGGGS